MGQVGVRCRTGGKCGWWGADSGGFAGAVIAVILAVAVLGDAPADPGGCLAVGGAAVQHAGSQVTAKGWAGEPEEALQPVDHVVTSSPVNRSICPVTMSSWSCGSPSVSAV